MPVVTIRGQGGAGAPELGRKVAELLQFDYVDRQIIAEVATRLNRQEQEVIKKEEPPNSLFGRIAEALGHTYSFGVENEALYLPAWEMPLDDDRYLQALDSVIKELAESGPIVIYGRGSQYILQDHPGALHVLVVAPWEIRVRRTMESEALDEESAKQSISRFDNTTRDFIKKYFKAERENPVYYDLVINTGRLSLDIAAAVVVDTFRLKIERRE